MPDREKLMSLIWHKQDCGLTHNANGQDFVTYNAELADHLISHGVTVRERGRWIPHYETFDADMAVGILGGNYQTGWQC